MLNLRPRATAPLLVNFGTDYQFKGRFLHTLEYNYFNKNDFHQLESLYEKIADCETDMISLFQSYLQQCSEPRSLPIADQVISNYIKGFFTKERDLAYVKDALSFFYLLRNSHYNLGKLIVMFNQFNFYVITNTLYFHGLKPAKCISYMHSVQKAINIDQELLVESFSERMLEQVIEEIGTLMDETTKIMFIKDLVHLLDKQNAEVQNSSAATEEMTASVNEVARSASKVADKTNESVKQAQESRQVISDALDEIFRTEATFSDIVKKFSRLQSNVSTIEDVVRLITGIADQTNLLALNASIEAARAGEHGKGFAVVAQEVRKLAENTVESLKMVQENVSNLKEVSNDVSDSIGGTAGVIQNAAKEAKDSLPLLTKIVETISDIHDDVNGTAAISEEQAATMDDISSQMHQIATLTDYIRELGDDTGSAIHSLGKRINQFRMNVIDNNSIVLSTPALLMLSKTDHYIWKWRIYNMFLGLEKVKPEEVSSHMDCRLGKWYYAPETKERFGHYDSFIRLEEEHKIVHREAKEAAAHFQNGNRNEAEASLKKLDQASLQVVGYIEDILSQIRQAR
ncbi:methyl-accepting chemotaxis protein [Bacillus ectoiniformans]|uniref:globin-coupled sensor protein n=1 Tax=Bacillus ectoiniformans TaxID=1494429 RepID=UPI0019575EED|nr:globin-coupled sensor protein [Bacillus ectoiniformans]MBM7647725.1 methyl-accepting chemotaxis protein [Bacillus ectoiniformans]